MRSKYSTKMRHPSTPGSVSTSRFFSHPNSNAKHYRRVMALAAAGLRQTEIARELGVSRQRVHQIVGHENNTPKPCGWCGKPFTPRDHFQTACSWQCKDQLDRVDYPKRRCDTCHEWFKPRTKVQRFCSIACNRHEKSVRRNQVMKQARRDHPPMVPGSSEPRPCLRCGTVFEPQRVASRFCSNKCKYTYYNHLHQRVRGELAV